MSLSNHRLEHSLLKPHYSKHIGDYRYDEDILCIPPLCMYVVRKTPDQTWKYILLIHRSVSITNYAETLLQPSYIFYV